MKRVMLLGLIVALCIIATPVVASYSCDPICEPDPNGSDKCCFGEGTPVSDSVAPDEWNDNPTCGDLGFKQGISFDPPNPVASGNILWDFNPADPFVTWSSSFPIDAVIMKGGMVGANVYYYSPPINGDSGLAPPVNTGSGKPAALSHIDFCYDNACICNDDGNECTAEICDSGICLHVNFPPGTECSMGECDGNGNCGVPTPVPEFPSLALPAAFIIGILGLVHVIRFRGK